MLGAASFTSRSSQHSVCCLTPSSTCSVTPAALLSVPPVLISCCPPASASPPLWTRPRLAACLQAQLSYISTCSFTTLLPASPLFPQIVNYKIVHFFNRLICIKTKNHSEGFHSVQQNVKSAANLPRHPKTNQFSDQFGWKQMNL